MSIVTINKKCLLILGVILLVTMACSLSGINSDESEALRQQVSALETQNAMLLAREPGSGDGSTGSERNGLQESNTGGTEDDVPPLPSEDQTELTISTPTPESLPTEPVEAGIPIIYDGWSMMVSKEVKTNNRSSFSIDVIVRNMTDNERVFRFKMAGVTITDEKGNAYPFNNDGVNVAKCEEMMHIAKNVTVDGNESVIIRSDVYCDRSIGLMFYQGPIPVDIDKLIVHFEDFGPFDNIDYVIDL